jgi:uncharacterized protein DUF6801
MTPLARFVSGAAVIVVMAVSSVSLGGTGIAEPAGTTLRYRCAMPLFPEQPMTVRLSWDIPKSVPVGQKTPNVPFKAVATMGAVVTDGLDAISAATVEGTADASGVVAAPEGNTTVGIPLTVPKTNVPPSGPISVVASGTASALVFHRPGRATITVGSEFTVRLTPRTADGGPTLIDQVDASCTLDPGQNRVLTSFEITAPRAEPAPAPDRPVPPATDGAATASGTPGTVTASPHGSTAAEDRATATSSGVPATRSTDATTAQGTAFTAVSSAGLADTFAPWLTGGAILVVVVVLGCVWWIRRRHRRGARGHPGPL